MKRLIHTGLVALALLVIAARANAQITVPNTFAAQQVISSSKINQNFDEIELKALNRTAPVMQATLLPDVTGSYDLGVTATRFRDLFLSRNATVGGTLTVVGTSTFAGATFSSGVTVTGTVTATTFSGSGASLTAVPAASLTGTITSATQDAITRLGTIVSGVWNGTAVGLQYGGTGLNMTATGGTSQFLKQNTLGGAITVVQPAVADLSDAATLPLLASANTFTNATNTFNASGAGFELGSTGGANSPRIDLHSSGNAIDYDTRISASGGTGVAGNGTLTVTGATITLSGNVSQSTSASMNWQLKYSTTAEATVNGAAIQAPSDGFVTMSMDCGASGDTRIGGLTDASNPPTTTRVQMDCTPGRTNSTMFPVKKGDFYKFNAVRVGGTITYTIYWVPLGTAG